LGWYLGYLSIGYGSAGWVLIHSVVGLKLFFSDPDPDLTFQIISDPDLIMNPTQFLMEEAKAKFKKKF
jgi:hypothetical protein